MVTTSTNSPLTIVIPARLQPEFDGSVDQVVMGMVAGPGVLTEGNEQFVVVTDPLAQNWLAAYAGANATIVTASKPSLMTQSRRWRAHIWPVSCASD